MLTVAEIHKALGFNEFTSEPTKVMLTQIANAAIAAYRAKLRQGVEMPEPFDRQYDEIDKEEFGIYGEGQLLFYGDARDQAGYLRGVEDAKGICERFAERGMHPAECAAAIDKLKGAV